MAPTGRTRNHAEATCSKFWVFADQYGLADPGDGRTDGNGEARSEAQTNANALSMLYSMQTATFPLSIFLFLACAVFCAVPCAVGGDGRDIRGRAADEIAVDRQLNLPVTPFDYESIALPKHVVAVAERFDNQPSDNPINNHGATLGRVLFYDPTLSIDGSTSCASCHLQSRAFAEEKAKSIGFAGGTVRRNSMSLVNLRYYRRGKFFWDERAESLEQQVLMPIEDPIEMGHRLADLEVQLQQDPIYPPLFAAAFGDQCVTRQRIANALAQFVRSIVSFRSRYDQGRELVQSVLDPFPNFSAQENLGKEQFFGRARCAECHLPDDGKLPLEHRQTAFFHLEKPMVNGIDNNTDEVDRGVGEISGRAEDDGKFKSSSLRNIELTGPYMHDGRFHTLDQVLEHYNWSVRPHENLDPRLEDFSANGLALPEVEKVALAAFLRTLTDHELVREPKYSDPFVSQSEATRGILSPQQGSAVVDP